MGASLPATMNLFRGALSMLLIAMTACSVATRNKKLGAGFAAGTAITGAAVYRATTGGCWAQCTHGRICDRASGTCVEAARGRAGSASSQWSVTPAGADTKWWEDDPPCPSGTALDRGDDDRVIRCASSDGTNDGPITFFYGNGRKEQEGWNCSGEPCRVWTHWDEDGQVLKVEDRGEPAAATRPR